MRGVSAYNAVNVGRDAVLPDYRRACMRKSCGGMKQKPRRVLGACCVLIGSIILLLFAPSWLTAVLIAGVLILLGARLL